MCICPTVVGDCVGCFLPPLVCPMHDLDAIMHSYALCSEFKMGTQIEDQQVSCLWQGSYLLSVSLSGYINYLDVNNPDKPLRVLKVQCPLITPPVLRNPLANI